MGAAEGVALRLLIRNRGSSLRRRKCKVYFVANSATLLPKLRMPGMQLQMASSRR